MMTDKLVDYKDLLLNTHNIILHGVPGTGKTYSAKEIAAKIVTGDNNKTYATLSPEEKAHIEAHIELVQFHPNYDYTDFVEGIRPVWSSQEGQEGQVGFELKDGVFKRFVEKVRRELEQDNLPLSDGLDDLRGIKLDDIDEEKLRDIINKFQEDKIEFYMVGGNSFSIDTFVEDQIKIKNDNRVISLRLVALLDIIKEDFIKNADVTVNKKMFYN